MDTVAFVTYPATPFGAPAYAEQLRQLIPPRFRFEVVPPNATHEQERSALLRATYVVGFPHLVGERMEAARHVKLIQLMSAGYDFFDIEAARRLGIPVANNGGANSWAVAEHTVLLMMAVLRQFPRQVANAHAGNWRKGLDSQAFFELARKTIGIVGFGHIGRRVARTLAGFDVEMLCYDVQRNEQAERELGVRYMDLPDLLASSDIVSVHIPLIPATRGFIGERELARMKRTAYLVNTARGGVLDERALYDALVAGRIAGAGLDTLDKEPAGKDNPLLGLPNVIVTPHMGGLVRDSWIRRCESAVENLERVAAGQPPRWRLC